MTQNEIKLTLQRGPDDPEFQEELRAFNKSLHSAGVTFSVPRKHFASAGAHGYQVAEYLITLSQAVGPTLGVILVAWLQGRSGRKVRLKIGDVEAEARTTEEVESLLQRAKEFQEEKFAGRRRM
jgi:hypothetical protein